MNPDYEKIATLVPKLHGWCDVPKAITLYNMVKATRPGVILEIGVWGGKSFIPMALAQLSNHREWDVAFRTIGIDPWDIGASVAGQTTEADKNWWKNINHELVYQNFIYNLKELGLECEIHRSKSSDVEPPSKIDLLHIDGNHGPDALSDTERFACKIPVGGFCVLDDLSWAGGFVSKSEEWLLEHGFVKLHPLGTGAAYLKLK